VCGGLFGGGFLELKGKRSAASVPYGDRADLSVCVRQTGLSGGFRQEPWMPVACSARVLGGRSWSKVLNWARCGMRGHGGDLGRDGNVVGDSVL
jgi:hypothetical protein